jgi:hypothetical protein
MNDKRIWDQPIDRKLPEEVELLGDKGYVGAQPTIRTPYKKPPRQLLEYDEWLFNTAHSWFRSPIEHFFGYLKRFSVLGGTQPPHKPHSPPARCSSTDALSSLAAAPERWRGAKSESGRSLYFAIVTVCIHLR